MPFSAAERQVMLNLRGVGPTVIDRLEQIGFCALIELKEQDAAYLTQQIATRIGSTCWRNSPQARASIQSIIDLANYSQSDRSNDCNS